MFKNKLSKKILLLSLLTSIFSLNEVNAMMRRPDQRRNSQVSLSSNRHSAVSKVKKYGGKGLKIAGSVLTFPLRIKNKAGKIKMIGLIISLFSGIAFYSYYGGANMDASLFYRGNIDNHLILAIYLARQAIKIFGVAGVINAIGRYRITDEIKNEGICVCAKRILLNVIAILVANKTRDNGFIFHAVKKALGRE